MGTQNSIPILQKTTELPDRCSTHGNSLLPIQKEEKSWLLKRNGNQIWNNLYYNSENNMEQFFTLEAPDGFEISWVLNFSQVTEKCIVFVHGLTGSMTEAHFYTAKEYFTRKGYAVCRFNLYSGWEKSRQLHECSMWDHALDIEVILSFLAKNYRDIVLVWHSLGASSIVGVSSFPSQVRKIIFWDGALDTSRTILRCFEKNGLWFFYPRNGRNVEISKILYDELLANQHESFLAKNVFPKKNMYMIFASQATHKYFQEKATKLGIDSCIIDWANHGFTQEGKYEELFEKTLTFIQK